jgi:hypothetical protein
VLREGNMKTTAGVTLTNRDYHESGKIDAFILSTPSGRLIKETIFNLLARSPKCTIVDHKQSLAIIMIKNNCYIASYRQVVSENYH